MSAYARVAPRKLVTQSSVTWYSCMDDLGMPGTSAINERFQWCPCLPNLACILFLLRILKHYIRKNYLLSLPQNSYTWQVFYSISCVANGTIHHNWNRQIEPDHNPNYKEWFHMYCTILKRISLIKLYALLYRNRRKNVCIRRWSNNPRYDRCRCLW